MKALNQFIITGLFHASTSIKSVFTSKIVLLILLVVVYGSLKAQKSNCKHLITINQLYVDATKMGILAGDTVCIEAGERSSLRISNFHGTAQNNIVFINCGGEVIIKGDDLQYGVSIVNSSYFRFTGTGDENIQYGIKVLKTKAGGTMGLGISERSTNFEVDHIEIANVGFAGIMAKTDPKKDLSSNRDNFTQYQSIFHDNYIHNTGGEGMYIGHSFYTGTTSVIDGKEVTLFPSVLKGVRIYNNRIDSTGWDGLQVGSATDDCEIFGNFVTNYGLQNISCQQSGVQLGGGTTGKCYNNYIAEGTGNGMSIFGLGNNDIYNNIILNPGNNFNTTEDKNIHGIFVDDRATIPGSSFNFYNNTIVNPKADGIRFYSVMSKNNKFHNNIIINPGSFKNYSKFSKESPYINIGSKTGIDAIISNNFLDVNADKIQFEDIENNNYKLASSSPALEAGLDLSNYGVETDFENNTRPIGRGYDLGAYQRAGGTNTSLESNTVADFAVYPNPCRGKFNISRNESSKVDVTIYNIQGKVVQTSKNITDKNLEFDVSDLAVNGKYYVTLNDEYGISTRSIIIE